MGHDGLRTATPAISASCLPDRHLEPKRLGRVHRSAHGLRPLVCLFALLVAAAVFAKNAVAVNYTWTGAQDSTWENQANWDAGDGTPGDDGFPDDENDRAILPANKPACTLSFNFATNYTIGDLSISLYTNVLTISGAGSTSLTVQDDNDDDLVTSTDSVLTITNDATFIVSSGIMSVSAGGTVNVNSTADLDISSGELTVAGVLNMNSTGTAQASERITVSGELNVSNGTVSSGGDFTGSGNVNVSNGTIEVGGRWDPTGTVTFADTNDTNTGILKFIGTTSPVSFEANGQTYNNIIIAKTNATGRVEIKDEFTATGRISIEKGILDNGALGSNKGRDFTCEGLKIAGTDAKYLRPDDGRTITFAGASDIFDPGPPGAVSNAADTENSTFNNITVNKNSGATLTQQTNNLTLSGAFSVVSGAYDLGSLSITTTGSTFSVAGAGFASAANGTVSFQSDGSQTFTPGSGTYGNIVVATNTALTITSGSTLTVLGDFTLNAGTGAAVVTVTNVDLSIGGNLTTNSRLVGEDTLDLTLTGSSSPQILSLGADNTIGSLTVQKGAFGDTVQLAQDLTVKGVVTITTGTLDLATGGNDTLTLRGDFSIGANGRFVKRTDTNESVRIDGTITLADNANQDLGNVTILAARQLNLASPLRASQLSIAASTSVFDANGFNTSLAGSFLNNGGAASVVDPGALTITNAAVATIRSGGATLGALTKNGAGELDVDGALNVASFSLTAGTFDLANGTQNNPMTVRGSFTISGGATFRSGTGEVKLAGPSGGSLRTGGQTITTLKIDAPGQTYTLQDALTTTTLTVAGGSTFELQTNQVSASTSNTTAPSIVVDGTLTQTENASSVTVNGDGGAFGGSGSITVNHLSLSGNNKVFSGTVSILGDMTNSGSFATNTATLRFAGGIGVQTFTPGGQSFNNVTCATSAGVTLTEGLRTTGTLRMEGGTLTLVSGTNEFAFLVGAGTSTIAGPSLTTTATTTVSTGTLNIDALATFSGAVSVGNGATLFLKKPLSDDRTFTFSSTTSILGALQVETSTSTSDQDVFVIHVGGVSIGDGASYTVTGATSGTAGKVEVQFQNGVTLTDTASLSVIRNATDTTVKFGGTTVVGSTSDNNTVVFRFKGNGTNRVKLRSLTDGTQWFLTYRRQTFAPGTPSDIDTVDVQDSNASAANLVRASGSNVNSGNNDNWSFGGDDTITGTLTSENGAALANKKVKLFRRSSTGGNAETVTGRTDGSGNFAFEITLQNDDRVVVFVNDEAGMVGATVAVVNDPGADGTIAGFSVTQNAVIIGVGHSSATGAITTEALNAVDADPTTGAGDSDVPFVVDNTTNALTISGTNKLVVTTSRSLTLSGNVSAAGKVEIDGTLTLATSTTNTFGSDVTVSGALSGGADNTVTGNMTVSGSVSGFTGSLTVNGSTGLTLAGAGSLSGANLTVTNGSIFHGSSGALTVTNATIGGDVSLSSSGDFNGASGGNVSVSGALTVSGAGAKFLTATTTSLGSVTSTGNGTIELRASSTTTVNGNCAPPKLTVNSGAALVIAGAAALTVPSGANTTEPAGASENWTIRFVGAGAQTATLNNNVTKANLVVDRSAAKTTISDATASVRSVTFSGGDLETKSLTTSGDVTIASGAGTWTFTGSSSEPRTVTISGSFFQSGGSYVANSNDELHVVNAFTQSGGTFSGGGTTNIEGNLTVGGGTFTGGGTLTVQKDMILNGGSFTAAPITNLAGDFSFNTGAAFAHNNSNFTFTGTDQKVITGTKEATFRTITVPDGKTLIILSNTTVEDHFSVPGSGGGLRLGGATITVKGTNPFQGNLLRVDTESSRVVYARTDADTVTVANFDYFNLTIKGGTATTFNLASPAPSLLIARNLAVESGTFDFAPPPAGSGNSVQVVGNVAVSGTGKIKSTLSGTPATRLFVDGNWTVVGASSVEFAAGTLVTFTGSTTTTIRATDATPGNRIAVFPDLQVEKLGLFEALLAGTAGNETDARVDGSLVVGAGTLNLNGRNLVSASGNITVNPGAKLTPGGTPGTSTVKVRGSGTIDGKGAAGDAKLNRLVIDGASSAVTVTVAGDVTVLSDVTMGDNVGDFDDALSLTGTLRFTGPGSSTDQVFFGNFDNNDFLPGTASTVVFAFAGTTTSGARIPGFGAVPPAVSYHNLRLDATLGGSYTLDEEVRLSGSLSIAGVFNHNDKKVTFAGGVNDATLDVGGNGLAAVDVDKTGGKQVSLLSDLETKAIAVKNGTFALGNKNVTAKGNVTVEASGNITASNGSVFTLDAAGSAGGALTVSGTGTVFHGLVTDDSAATNALTLDGSFSVGGQLTINEQTSFTGSGTIKFLGAGTPLVANAPFALGSGTTIDFAGGNADVPGGSENVAQYGKLRMSGGGTYTLASDVSILTALEVGTGTFRAIDLVVSMAVSATVLVDSTGTLRIEETAATGAGGLEFGNGASLTVNGRFEMIGASDANRVQIAGAPGATYSFLVTGPSSQIEGRWYHVSGTDARGLQIDSNATIVGGNEGLRDGRFTVSDGSVGLNIAIYNQDLTFNEIKFFRATPATIPVTARNVRHRTALVGGDAPNTFLRFRNSFAGNPFGATGQAALGDLWGDEFDDDPGDETTTNRVTGTIRWDDLNPPLITGIESRDSDADGRVDRIKVAFNEPIGYVPAQPNGGINPAGFAIAGTAATSVVDPGADNPLEIFVDFDTQILGTEPKTVEYAATGLVRDAGGQALGATSVAATDKAGPVILSAVYNNQDNAIVGDDVMVVTFSESVLNADSTADFLTSVGFMSGSVTPNGDKATYVADGVTPSDPPGGTTIQIVSGSDAGVHIRDAANNFAASGNKPAVIASFDAGAPDNEQARTFDVTASTSSATVGNAVEFVIVARDRQGARIPNFRARGGLQIAILDNALANNPGLATRSLTGGDLDFTNFLPFSTRGDTVTFDAEAPTAVFTVVTPGISPARAVFDSNGEFRINLSNTKATANRTDAAGFVKIRVTEIDTGTTGALGGNVAWNHGVAANVLTLLTEESLVEGVRSRRLDVAVPSVGVIEREAGVTHTARVILVDEFFNVAKNDPLASDDVLVRPLEGSDPRRTANLEGTDGQPLDTPQGATLVAGEASVPVKDFLAALGRRLFARLESAPSLPHIPSTPYDVYPGEMKKLAIVLPGQTLLQGVASTEDPVKGLPVTIAQGNAFVAQIVAVDAHGNWDFRFPDNAIVAKTNDDTDPIAQRLGVSISGIGAAQSIGSSKQDLELQFNNEPLTSFDLDNRGTATEIQELLLARMRALPFAAANQGDVQFFVPFSRYVIRSGEPPSGGVESRVVATPVSVPGDSSTPPFNAEVNILRLGEEWTSSGARGDDVYVEEGRGAHEFSAPLYTPRETADDDLNDPDFENVLAFKHGIAFVSAVSNVKVEDPDRKLIVRLRNTSGNLGDDEVFESSGFVVEESVLRIDSVELFDDNPTDGQIDHLVMRFQATDTIDATAAAQLTASSFRLVLTRGTGAIVRTGSSVRASESTNTLEVFFSPGLPTTSVSGVTVFGPSEVRGKQTAIDLSGGIHTLAAPNNTALTDRAPPRVVATNLIPGFLEVVFSEPIEFSPGFGATVSGVIADPVGISVAGTFTFEDNGGAVTVNFGAGVTGIANIVNAIRTAGVDASFEHGRLVLRSSVPASGTTRSFARVTTETGGAATTLQLKVGTSVPAGAHEIEGTDDPLNAEVADFLVATSRRIDLLAGVPFIDGNRLLIPIDDAGIGDTKPFFALLDNFTKNFIRDLSDERNQVTTVISTVPGLETQNVATNSGFIRAREADSVSGDGIFQQVQPGFFQTDIADSPIPSAAVIDVQFLGVNRSPAPPIAPRLLFPESTGSLGNSLDATQVGLVLRSAGSYLLTYAVKVDPESLPIGFATGADGTITRSFEIQVSDVAPVAQLAPNPIVAAAGSQVTLDASRSVDPNGDGLTFKWEQISGPASATGLPSGFSPSNAVVTPTLAPSVSGTYVFRVTVDESVTNSSGAGSAEIVVVAQGANALPTADAGVDRVVRVGEQVILDGRASIDPEGSTLAFVWSQLSGSAVTVANATAPQASFTAPGTPGVLVFRLVVTDSNGNVSRPDTVAITVVSDTNRPPFATFRPTIGAIDADGDGAADFGVVDQRITLDASGTQSVPSLKRLDWVQTGGPTVTLDRSGTTASFVPYATGNYRFRLQAANANDVAGSAFELSVPVLLSAAQDPPRAVADADPAVVSVGDTVTLDASGSTDTDGTPGNLRFRWHQIGGPLTPLSDSTAATPTVTPGAEGVYTYEVLVYDPDTLTEARAQVTFAANGATPLPLAAFAPVPDGAVGVPVRLQASGTAGPGAGPLAFVFSQTGGLPSALEGAPGARQQFTPAAGGRYTFTLFAIDNAGRRSLPATQSFSVAGAPSGPEPPKGGGRRGGGGGGGGCAIAAAEANGVESLLPYLVALVAIAAVRARQWLGRAAVVIALLAAGSLGAGCAAGVVGAAIVATAGGGGGGAGIDRTQPDLVASGVSGPTIARIEDDGTSQRVIFEGDGGRLRMNVLNQGTDVTRTDFEVAWFLSKTKAIDESAFKVRAAVVTDRIGIGGAVRVVSEGGTETALGPVVAGKKIEPGRYFLLARVNSGLRKEKELSDATASANNDQLSSQVVQVYEPATPPAGGEADFAISDMTMPTAAIMGVTTTGLIRLTNVGASSTTQTALDYEVFFVPETAESIEVGEVPIGSGSFSVPPLDQNGEVKLVVTFKLDSTGAESERGRLAVRLSNASAGDSNADNNTRFSGAPTTFYEDNTIVSNGANLPLTNPSDPTLLDITTQRPAISTTLAAGRQRLLSFQIPDTGANPLVSQAIITVNSTNFDPIVEVLSTAGTTLEVIDDFAGAKRAVSYVTLRGTRDNRLFFLVVTGASATDSGNFTVSIDLNSMVPEDDRPVIAHEVGDFVSLGDDGALLVFAPAPTDPENATATVSVPFEFAGLENEFFVVVPAPGRFALSIETADGEPLDPLFLDPDRTTLVGYDAVGSPSAVPVLIERDATNPHKLQLRSLERDGRFPLAAGEYALVLRANFLPVRLDQEFRLVFGPALQFDRSVR